MESTEQTVSINEFRKNSERFKDDYEVWDETTQTWINYNSSKYEDQICEFPEPSKADYPINLITIYDTALKEYHTWALGKSTRKQATILYQYTDEVKMLSDFLDWFSHNYPDVISGWNSMFFDIPYIVNRLIKILPEKVALISPVGNYYKKMRMLKQKQTLTYAIEGISHLDYLVLYRDKFGGERRHSYKLDAIADIELGISKLKYEGKMRDFYIDHFDDFIEYNLRDVEILWKLEEKLNLIKLCRQICNIGLCEYESIYGSISYIYNAIKIFQKQTKFLAFPALKKETEEQVTDFEGAYVKKPKTGIYRRGVAGLDVSSLYPNTMIALNLSPETKFGKIVGKIGNDYRVKVKDQEKVWTEAQLQFLLENKCTKSANNILFIKPDIKKGIIPAFLESLRMKRKKHQAKMRSLELKLSHLEETDPTNVADKKDLEVQIQTENIFQNGYKTIMNSSYGILSSKYCPIFDLDNAEAITLTGQEVTKRSADHIDEYFKSKGQVGDVTIYGDTDSVFFDCEPMVNEIIGKDSKLTKKNIAIVCKELDKFVIEDVNRFCFEGIIKPILHSNIDCIEFKRETFSSEAIFLTKKRYILHIKDKEGKPIDKFKVTGYDTKKTEIPIKIRDCLKDITEKTLSENWDNKKYVQVITDMWEEYKKYPIEDIAIFKGYNTEKTSIGFLRANKGAGINAKAALFYNNLLDEFNLTDRHPKIMLGDRLRYCYIKDNQYKIRYIGFSDKFPEEFKEHFYPDYKLMFQKTVLKPLKSFCEVLGWGQIDPTDDIEKSVLDL